MDTELCFEHYQLDEFQKLKKRMIAIHQEEVKK